MFFFKKFLMLILFFQIKNYLESLNNIVFTSYLKCPNTGLLSVKLKVFQVCSHVDTYETMKYVIPVLLFKKLGKL